MSWTCAMPQNEGAQTYMYRQPRPDSTDSYFTPRSQQPLHNSAQWMRMARLSTIFFLLTLLTFKSSSIANETASTVSDIAKRTKHHGLQERSLSSSRSNNVWNIINDMNEYKSGRIFTQNTFSKFHYLVLPIWWSDESNNQATRVDQIKSALDGAVDDYKKQSFKKFSLTYEILPQWRIGVSKINPRWFGTRDACFNYVASRGYVQGRDFDGILMIHNEAASGIFDHSGGGLATVNGDFATMSTPLDWKVTRHEIGKYSYLLHTMKVDAICKNFERFCTIDVLNCLFFHLDRS